MSDKQLLPLEDARIIWPNFGGKEGKFNPAGSRNFCVIIPDKLLAKDLIKKGWNIRFLKDTDDEGKPIEGEAYTQVKVMYGGRPPKIMLIAGSTKTLLTEADVHLLDSADILKVDMIVSPFLWEVNSNKGIKGYLREMYVTIEQSIFAEKYDDFGRPPEESETV